MYSLAVRHLYPEYETRESEFLFLKFELNKDMFKNFSKGIIRMDPVEPEELTGLEHELSEIQSYIDTFDEEKAVSNFAGAQPYPSDGTFGGPLACGKDGYKISRGQPVLDKNGDPIVAFICSYRKPFSYLALKDDNGNVISTAFEDDEESLLKKKKPNQTIELMEYEGCPYWKAPEEVTEHNDLFG